MISIIVPVYNAGRYLEACLNSLLAQTVSDFEVLLVDDGSTDESGQIADSFAAADSRVKAFHKNNAGVASARNYGLDHLAPESQYICFVDSDDWAEPDLLETLLEKAESGNADIVSGGYYEERSFSKVIAPKEGDWEGREALVPLATRTVRDYLWSKLFKKELFDGLRFTEGIYYEDVAISWWVFSRSARLVQISSPLYHYRIREGSISHSSHLKNLVDYWNVYRDRFEFLSSVPEVQAEKTALDCVGLYCVRAACRFWGHLYNCKKEERTSEVAAQTSAAISEYVRTTFPKTPPKNWSGSVGLIYRLVRWNHPLSLWAAHILHKVYRLARKLKSFFRGKGKSQRNV